VTNDWDQCQQHKSDVGFTLYLFNLIFKVINILSAEELNVYVGEVIEAVFYGDRVCIMMGKCKL